MVGWLEYILEIPDTFAITRGTASGNLSVTVQKEQSEVGQYDWALRRYHGEDKWLKMCKEPNTATDRDLINEANLLIYVIVMALRLDLCKANAFEYSALPLAVDGTFDVVAYAAGNGVQPIWWANHRNLLNGDEVIAEMEWEVVRVNPKGDALEPMYAGLNAALPGNLIWTWDSQLNGINPDSDRHTRTNGNRHEIWLPRLNLSVLPDCVQRALLDWSDNAMGSSSVTMHTADWPTVVSSRAVPQHFATIYANKKWRGGMGQAPPAEN